MLFFWEGWDGPPPSRVKRLMFEEDLAIGPPPSSREGERSDSGVPGVGPDGWIDTCVHHLYKGV